MTILFILPCMLFLHIVDDYYLQGILASMKQKSWWIKNPEYNEMYCNDYIIALMMHAFSWAFMIMLPIAIYMHFEISAVFLLVLGMNFVIHAIIDDMKANKKWINLVVDQTIHVLQIVATYLTFILIMA